MSASAAGRVGYKGHDASEGSRMGITEGAHCIYHTNWRYQRSPLEEGCSGRAALLFNARLRRRRERLEEQTWALTLGIMVDPEPDAGKEEDGELAPPLLMGEDGDVPGEDDGGAFGAEPFSTKMFSCAPSLKPYRLL